MTREERRGGEMRGEWRGLSPGLLVEHLYISRVPRRKE